LPAGNGGDRHSDPIGGGRLNVYALGPAGTFSHELALRHYGNEINLLPTIHQIFGVVEKGAGIGVIPIENSEAGGVGATLDGLQRFNVCIIGEAYMEIHHNLVGFEPPALLERIYVHPQTHEQCSELLGKLGKEVVHTSSNAASAQEMKKTLHSGAVVSRMTAELYHLPILVPDIENNPDNITRFISISDNPGSFTGATKCSILIDPQADRAGLLHTILGVFARRGINLTRIESRPSKRGMGRYVFFIDLAFSDGWKDAIGELMEMTRVKHLGCYSRLEESW
jgi:prephenate dehydratase